MDFEKILQHPDFENYVCVNFALVFVCQELKSYTEHGLKQVHQKIKKQLGKGKSECIGTCGDRQTLWCKNCKNWQKHLEDYTSKKKQIDWNKQTTANWDELFKNIAGVFSEPKKKIDGPANYLDMSTACNVWECCSIFQIDKIYIKNVRESRNNFVHNYIYTLLISDLDKSKVFDALKDLLKDKDVQPHIQMIDSLNALDKIKCIPQSNLRKTIEEIKLKTELKKMESCDEENIKRLEQITISTIENSNVLKEIPKKIEAMSIQQRLNHMESIHMLSGIKRYIQMILVAVLLVLCCILASFYFIPSRHVSNEVSDNVPPENDKANIRNIYQGCLSERSNYPFKLQIAMIWYLPIENEFVGREWLLEILEARIVHDRMSSGTLLAADYGFGKSAIISQLLCAKENENGWMLRRHIIAFHVCFDSHDLTKNPVLLIRRLIWFLSNKSIWYSMFIETLKNTAIFDENECANDISACFDHAITLPLKKLPVPDDAPWIIVIDALDECSDSDDRNRILDLLSKKLSLMQIDLPKWLKWMITSKKRYKNSLQKLTSLEIDYMDPRNQNDIKLYLMKHLNVSDAQLIKQFADKSQGNILYLKHALEYIFESGNVSLQNFINLPDDIKLLYELNFNRHFETNNDFEVAKIILQLISVHKMSTDTVFEILETNELCDKSEFSRIMRKLELYLSSDNYVTFKHNSLYDWLISNSSTTYRISSRSGHSMFSNYLLSLHYIFYRYSDLSALVYHVAKSEDEHVKRSLFDLKIDNVAELYHWLRLVASVKIFKLLSEYIKRNETRSHLLNDFLKVASITAIYDDRVDILSHIHEHEIEITNIIQFPFILASRTCSKNIFMYLINVVGVFYDEYVIDTLFINRCMNILETIVPTDALVINSRTLDKAIFGYNPYYDIIDVIKLFVINNMEIVCDENLKQLKKMLELTSYPRYVTLYPLIFTNLPLHALAHTHFNHSENLRLADSVRMFITKYPQLLSCRYNGLTPFFYYIVIGKVQLFMNFLTNNVLNEQCPPIPNVWLYLHFTFMKYLRYHFFVYSD